MMAIYTLSNDIFRFYNIYPYKYPIFIDANYSMLLEPSCYYNFIDYNIPYYG